MRDLTASGPRHADLDDGAQEQADQIEQARREITRLQAEIAFSLWQAKQTVDFTTALCGLG